MLETESSQTDHPRQRWRETIDAALDAYTGFSNDCPAPLAEAIRYSLLGPGKRLRPRLVLLAAEACGGSDDAALPAACAVEMIHAYSLVHDDLPAMDDDQLRRGRPTCHKAFGEALAILAGDALLALAFEVVATRIQPAETAAACCAELARAAGATALVGGQADDLDGSCGLGDIRQLEQTHRRKTGAMFRASLRIGGIVAGADNRQIEALGAYGANIGLAFQITDDLLDVAGDERAVGKQIGKDADRGRLTYPAVLGVEASGHRVAMLVEAACDALAVFGSQATRLVALAQTIPQRDR
jgi:geranylgeranyl diphosphate synthase type II